MKIQANLKDFLGLGGLLRCMDSLVRYLLHQAYFSAHSVSWIAVSTNFFFLDWIVCTVRLFFSDYISSHALSVKHFNFQSVGCHWLFIDLTWWYYKGPACMPTSFWGSGRYSCYVSVFSALVYYDSFLLISACACHVMMYSVPFLSFPTATPCK